METITCKICGDVADPAKYIPETENFMRKNCMCFRCAYWACQHELDMTERKDYRYAISNGVHYTLHAPGTGFQGFGGQKFKITFNDGTVKECKNMWCQGDIPEGYWRSIMSDNAKVKPIN